MITLKTATGKEFESDYAVTVPNVPLLYMTIVNTPFEQVVATLLQKEELPFEGYEGYRTISGFDKIDDNRTKVILKP